MKIYLSGKITDCSNYKEKFADIEKRLTALGHDVFNPCIFPSFMDYEQYMSLDFLALSFMDAIFLMDNWKYSNGARREKLEAERLGLRILTEKDILVAETLLKLCEDSEMVAQSGFEMDGDEEYRSRIFEMSNRIKTVLKNNDIFDLETLFHVMAINLSPEEKYSFFEDFVREGDYQITMDLEDDMTNGTIRERYHKMIGCSKELEEAFRGFKNTKVRCIA